TGRKLARSASEHLAFWGEGDPRDALSQNLLSPLSTAVVALFEIHPTLRADSFPPSHSLVSSQCQFHQRQGNLSQRRYTRYPRRMPPPASASPPPPPPPSATAAAAPATAAAAPPPDPAPGSSRRGRMVE
ncbi:unnamed protein product, partial [Closterium sp. NIES-53]